MNISSNYNRFFNSEIVEKLAILRISKNIFFKILLVILSLIFLFIKHRWIFQLEQMYFIQKES